MPSKTPLNWLPRGQACMTCRQHKTKCDAEKPNCGQCIRSNRECYYDPSLSRTKRLEERIRNLEAQIKIAEEQTSSVTPAWSNPVLMNGGANIHAATWESMVPWYPGKRASMFDNEYFVLRHHNAPYITLLPREFILRDLDLWNRNEEVPPCVRRRLLRIFLAQRDQFNFDVNFERLERCIVLPQSDPNSLHPALLNAIFLGACSCCGPELGAYGDLFLKRAREELSRSLAHADRLEHFLWASVFVCWLWIRQGRVLEAHTCSTSLVRFALACGLSGISNPEEYASRPAGLLGPLRDQEHLAERINLWWAIYILDRRVAVASGLPPGVYDQSHGTISTVWPKPVELVSVEPKGWRPGSIPELLMHGTKSTTVTDESLIALRAKASALMDRAFWTAHLVKQNHLGTPFWTIRTSVMNALIIFRKTMPSVTDRRELEDGEIHEKTHDNDPASWQPRANPTLVLVRSIIHVALIVLYQIDAEKDDIVYEKCLESARCIAVDGRAIGNISPVYAHVCLGPIWYGACEVLAREVRRNDPPVNPPQARRLRRAQDDLDTLVRLLSQLISYYPGLHVYISRVSSLLDLRRGAGSALSLALSASDQLQSVHLSSGQL